MDINLLIDEIKEQGSEFKKAFTKRIIFTSKEVISGAPMMFLKGKAKELIKKELSASGETWKRSDGSSLPTGF